MRYVFLWLLLGSISFSVRAQDFFYINNYDINVLVNRDASIDVTEKIDVHFTEPRHGIFRKIPYRYKLENLPDSVQRVNVAWESNGYRYTEIRKLKVKDFKSEIYSEGDYKVIKIGSKDKYVNGDQTYEISYTVIGAINFFSDFSELYLNLTGDGWPVEIKSAKFRVQLYKPLSTSPNWFVATGPIGSVNNETNSRWTGNLVLEGRTLTVLPAFNGITAGIRMPAGFLSKPDYRTMGKGWLALPVLVFILMYLIWNRWGKDIPVTVTTEFYPPDEISPSVAGYIIDGKLDRRDLTALIPFWGAGGYIKVEELEESKFFGLMKNHDYKFSKLKDLPAGKKVFERTMFDGLFSGGDEVLLSDLKNTFYTTMSAAKKDLESEINTEHYYVRYTRTFSSVLPIIGVVFLVFSLVNFFSSYPLDIFLWGSVAASSVIIIVFGSLMGKKTQKGTELYQKLSGFREFIKSVEKDRLKEFLNQDQNYFDKVLPFAIVFDVADAWKDKLKGLEVPPPSWYSGYYAGSVFNTMNFMNSLDRGMNSMSQSFYSRPSSSGSSGGSFGGGGFSGGGFGGGGGGSW